MQITPGDKMDCFKLANASYTSRVAFFGQKTSDHVWVSCEKCAVWMQGGECPCITTLNNFFCITMYPNQFFITTLNSFFYHYPEQFFCIDTLNFFSFWEMRRSQAILQSMRFLFWESLWQSTHPTFWTPHLGPCMAAPPISLWCKPPATYIISALLFGWRLCLTS